MVKPLIGITAPTVNINLNMSLKQSVTVLANAYIQLVNEYDCTPIVIPSLLDEAQINSIVTILDGLILSSGQDLSPELYQSSVNVRYSHDTLGIGERFNRPMMTAPNIHRDRMELSAYQTAKIKGIPILGICRGMQLINVAEGGTLYEELPKTSIEHYLEPDGWINYHDIEIIPNTLCAKLLCTTKTIASSLHHQGVKEIGKDLCVAGTAPDGVIELIEHKDHKRFIVGVQSHIEKTRKNQPIFESIYKAFFNQSQLMNKIFEREI